MTYIKHIQVSNFNFDGPLNKRFPGYKDDWIKIALSLLESDSTQKMLSSAILLIGACYKKCFNVPCNFFKKVIGQQNILIWIRSTAKKCTFGRCKNLYYFSYLSSHRKHEWAPLNSPAMAGKQNNNVKGETLWRDFDHLSLFLQNCKTPH